MKPTYIIISILLISCGPSSKLRRAERLIAKAETEGATWKTDTVYKEITVYTPKIEVDTLVQNVTDTIVVQKDKLITKVKVNYRDREVYIKSKCDTDTVYQKVYHTITKQIKVNSRPTYWDLIIAVIAALFFGYLLRAFGVGPK